MRALIDIPDEQAGPLAEFCRHNAISRADVDRGQELSHFRGWI
jgi:hypothetical protein